MIVYTQYIIVSVLIIFYFFFISFAIENTHAVRLRKRVKRQHRITCTIEKKKKKLNYILFKQTSRKCLKKKKCQGCFTHMVGKHSFIMRNIQSCLSGKKKIGIFFIL